MRRLIILPVVLFVWFFSVASSPEVTGAKVRINAKKYADAVKVLEGAMGKYPDDPELYYYLGLAYAGMAQWVKAGENFSKALTKDPSRKLRRNIEKSGDKYWISFVREASTLLDQKRFAEAIKKFRTANSINPDREESQANLGVALLEEARLLQSAENPQPDSAQVLIAEAVECFKRAKELDPENKQFTLNLSQAYLMAGKTEEAIELYEGYLEENPEDFEVMRQLVTVHMSNRDFESASQLYDQMLEDSGAELSLADYFNAGTCYYQLFFKFDKEENEEAKQKASEYLKKSAECYAEVYRQDPTDCEAGEQLYYIYITMEKWEDVIETIETMLSNGCERSYATLQNLGVAYMKTDQKQKAIEVFKEADSKKPKENEGSN